MPRARLGAHHTRDFEGVAERLAGEWRVIAVDLRGRGESAYAKDSATYMPMTYVQDLKALLAELGVARFVVLPTEGDAPRVAEAAIAVVD